MKKCIILILCLFTVGVLADPITNLNVLDADIVVGETFDVEVWIDGDGLYDDDGFELTSFGFDVDPGASLSFIQYNGFTMEGGLDFNGNYVTFDDGSDDMVDNDVIGLAFPGIAEDDILLATLSFTALAEGSDVLEVVGLKDGMFYGLFYTNLIDFPDPDFDISASVAINVSAGNHGVPEPSTVILLGLGLLSCGILKRKK